MDSYQKKGRIKEEMRKNERLNGGNKRCPDGN